MVDDAENSVFAWLRRAPEVKPVAVISNMTPSMLPGYRLPLPHDGKWNEVLNTDSVHYGGSGKGNLGQVRASGGAALVTLPPLATIMLEYAGE